VGIDLSGMTPIDYFFWALLIGAFVVEAWAFVDAIRHPAAAYTAAGKQTKPLWLIILGVAFVIGIAGALDRLSIISILPIVAFVAAAIYLADVRPKVREIKGNSSHNGPYGPW
jgi:predicted acyltransferase